MSNPQFESPNPGCRGCATALVKGVVCLFVIAAGLVALAVIS